MRRAHAYLPQTTDAVVVLGLEIEAARRRRRMSAEELAERSGISPATLRRVERGDPTVAIGIVFEAAGLVGIELFGVNPADLPALVRRNQDRLALLPARLRTAADPHNAFRP